MVSEDEIQDAMMAISEEADTIYNLAKWNDTDDGVETFRAAERIWEITGAILYKMRKSK